MIIKLNDEPTKQKISYLIGSILEEHNKNTLEIKIDFFKDDKSIVINFNSGILLENEDTLIIKEILKWKNTCLEICLKINSEVKNNKKIKITEYEDKNIIKKEFKEEYNDKDFYESKNIKDFLN